MAEDLAVRGGKRRPPKEVRREELEDLRQLLRMGTGRRFFLRLLDRATVWQSVGSLDGALMAYHEGRRNVGLWLLAELGHADPEAPGRLMGDFYRRDRDDERPSHTEE